MMQKESFCWHLNEPCRKGKDRMSADKHYKLLLINKHGQQYKASANQQEDR